MARFDRAIPWLVSAILLVTYGPGLAGSPLLQGDLPGHLESVRWSAVHLWPQPWGWDPRYLLGAPWGVLYPPLLSWLGATLAQAVGPEWALKFLLAASVTATPPCVAAAARGFGLRHAGAACAAVAGTAVLWLPGTGLGGTFRQTFVAGNAANALALPLFLLFLARLRRTLAGHAGIPAAAAWLAAVLLSHFVLGAAAGAILLAYATAALVRGRFSRVRRSAAVAALAGGGASPFLLPFLVHLREASPDGIAFSPRPSPAEWTVFLLASAALFAAGPRARRALGPGFALVGALFAARSVLFPLLGQPAFRMEYHRFRLLVYLAAVPAALLAAERIVGRRGGARALAVGGTVVVAAFAFLAPYDARGPGPVPLPAPVPGLEAGRILVLASPSTQNGAWHGLQLRVPPAMGVEGAKGLFVEATPFARPVFEAERAASGPRATPRWWAIRTSPGDLRVPDDLARRLAGLGVGAVIAREPVSPELLTLAAGAGTSLGNGFVLLRLPPLPADGTTGWTGLPPLSGTPLPARGRGVRTIERSPSGDRVTVRFDGEEGGRVVLLTFAHSDWRVEEGSGEIDAVPLAPEMGIDAPLLGLRGRGVVTVRHRPRLEEWSGLAVGVAAWGVAIAAGAARRRRRRRRRRRKTG